MANLRNTNVDFVTYERKPYQAFSLWFKEDYHQKVHGGIDEKPIDRYHCSIKHSEIKRLTRTGLDEIFLVRHERVVGNDATISFKGKIYEVPAAYIRQRIEIRHPEDDREALHLFENGALQELRLLTNYSEVQHLEAAGWDGPLPKNELSFGVRITD